MIWDKIMNMAAAFQSDYKTWYAQAKHLKKVKIKNEMKSEKMRDIEKK
jgi:hypothetical protein